MITGIIIAIVAVLLVVGTSQRKKIATWVKSETNDIVDKNMDPTKVAKLKLKEAQDALVKMVDSACTIKAQLLSVERGKAAIKAKIEAARASAIAHKEAGNDGSGKQKMTLLMALTAELTPIDAQIKALTTRIEQVEKAVGSYRISIEQLKVRVSTIDANTKTADVLKQVIDCNSALVGGSIVDMEEISQVELDTQTARLDMNEVELESSTVTSVEVDEAYNEL